MKSKIFVGAPAMLSFIVAMQVQALPTLYPDNFNTGIRNTTNSNVVADNLNRTRFYVLPPSDAKAEVTGLHTVSANVGFCEEISKLQKYNLDTIGLLNSMKSKDLATKNILDQQNTKLAQANEELSKFIATAHLQELASLDSKVIQLEKRLDELYARYKHCNQECGVLNKDIEDSQFLRTELTAKRFELSSADLIASTEYEQKKFYVTGIRNNVEDLQKNWKQIRSDLMDLYIDFNKMFDAHAGREGGRVAISFNSGWSENMRLLAIQNPNLRFEKIQTKNATIKASAYSRNNLVSGGAVLAFDVGGKSTNDLLSLEAYPENFSGNAVLNLLGVCPLLHPDWFDIIVPKSVENMTYGITVGFEYPVAMKYEVTAHYNMNRMYELIKSQGTSGGFFSSSSWSDQSEQEFFKDSFSVDWKIQDDKQIISNEQKLTVNSDLRRQVMTRMAGQMVLNNQTAQMNLAFELPKSGALVLSNSLEKTCPLNIYCRGASIIVNVLQAILGSSNTQQSLTQIADIDMIDHYSNEQMVLQPMITTFK